jgi:oligopeptide/dipeptide ABC transporter ATP-binding protein
MSDVLVVRNLSTHFFLYQGVVKALSGVNLTVRPGEMLGLVGETGSGKSVVAYSVVRLVPAPGRIVEGEILFQGEDLLEVDEAEMRRIRGGRLSLIVANPRMRLNPMARVGDQIAAVYQAHNPGSRDDVHDLVIKMLNAVGLNDPERRADSYPHELSGGMAQRIVIAMGLICSPELVIADDPTFGLDVTIQRQVMDLMWELIRQKAASTLIITHDLGIVAQYCQRVAVIYAGQIVEEAPVAAFFAQARHPYSRSLLGSVRTVGRERERLPLIGSPPDPLHLPGGCVLHPRCPAALPVCEVARPEVLELAPDHVVVCHRAEESLDGFLIGG